MSVQTIRGESKILATLNTDARVSVVEHLAAKPQGTAMASIARVLTLGRETTAELTSDEYAASVKPTPLHLDEDEAIAWGLALAALHMMPNRERIWI